MAEKKIRNYLFGRLDPEHEKWREERAKRTRTFKEKVYSFFDDRFGEREDAKRTLMRKDICATDKLYLLGSPGYLLPRDAVKLMYSNDPEVRKLQRKTVISSIPTMNDPDDELGWGAMMRKALQDETDKPFDEVCKKGVPKYIYEPHVRYKRTENSDYKRHKNYSIAGTITGVGMLATGIASGILPLAYAGAALTLASFGYRSGHWIRTRKEDQIFEKLPSSLSELEKKAQKPGNPDSHYQSNHAGSLSDIAAKESYKDDALYVKRLYQVVPPRFTGDSSGFGWERIPFHYSSTDTWNKPWGSGWGWLGAALTAVAAISAGFAYYPSDAAISLAIAGSTGLATLGHYAGYIFGGKVAEYRKV